MRTALLFIVAVPGVLAAQVPANDSAYEVAPIVITAERTPLPAGVVSGSITVLQGDELRARGVRSVADALREVPGAAVVSSGSYGGQTSLFLRGGESDHVKVLVDGVAMNQPGGAFNWNALTLDDVERIEVVRGPGSVLYGTDALAGVVQVFTRSGRGPVALDAAVRGGTYGALRAEGAASGGSDRFSWSVGASNDRTDGIYDFNSAWRNTVATGRASFAVTSATTLRGSLRYGDDVYHYPTDFTGVPVDRNTVNTHSATTASLGVDHRLDAAILLAVTASFNAESHGSLDGRDDAADTLGFGYASRSDVDVRRAMLDARMTLAPGTAWSLVYGIDARRDVEDRKQGYTLSEFGGFQDSSVSAPVEHTRQDAGAYLQALLEPAEGWSASGGMRVDDDEEFGQFLSSRIGLVRRFGVATRVRGSYGTGFKTPTLEETYGNTTFSMGNPDLVPERSESWEIAAEQGLFEGRVTLGATWFHQHFRDLVQYGFLTPGAPTYYNVASATAKGLELSAVVRPDAFLSVNLGYTYLKTEVTDPGFSSGAGDAFVQGKELIRRPAHQARLGATWLGFGRARLSAELAYVGRRTDVDFGAGTREQLDGYALLDLGADITLLPAANGRPSLALTLRAENALDTDYETVIGYPGRGRVLLGGVRLHR